MSASRLKIVPQSETDEGQVSLEMPLGFASPDSSPFRMLSDAVQSFETLQRRCAAAEDLCHRQAAGHAQAIGEAEGMIFEKQKRIEYLEAVLAEFKRGLQSFAEEASQQAEDLRESEAVREELTITLAQTTEDLRRAQQHNLQLEKNAEAAQGQQKLMLDLASCQADYLANQQLRIAAEEQALHETRAAMRTILDHAGRF